MLEFDVTNFINGAMVVGDSDRVLDSVNPANGELLARVRYAGAEQAERRCRRQKPARKSGHPAVVRSGAGCLTRWLA